MRDLGLFLLGKWSQKGRVDFEALVFLQLSLLMLGTLKLIYKSNTF
jgi:hypothetical protein